MDSKTITTPTIKPPPPQPPSSSPKSKDFLIHLETYLAKRDGVDKLLKISRYATKIILATNKLPADSPLNDRLKSFESSVGLSRKAFRLGKFVQDLNSLRSSHFDSTHETLFTIIAYGGEGGYFFIEQFVWLSKSGLMDRKHSKNLGKISAWPEFIGYIGSVSLKIRDLEGLNWDEACLVSSIEVSSTRGVKCDEEMGRLKTVREKVLMKKLSIVQDFADGLMALADIRGGKGKVLSSPFVVACAGLLSALISTHKNWVSC